LHSFVAKILRILHYCIAPYFTGDIYIESNLVFEEQGLPMKNSQVHGEIIYFDVSDGPIIATYCIFRVEKEFNQNTQSLTCFLVQALQAGLATLASVEPSLRELDERDIDLLKAAGLNMKRLKSMNYEELKTFLTEKYPTSWQHGPAHCRLVLEKFRFASFEKDVECELVPCDDVEDRCFLIKDDLEAAHASFEKELAEPKRALRQVLDEMCAEKGEVRWIGHNQHDSWVQIWKRIQELSPQRPDLCNAAKYKNSVSLANFCMYNSGFWDAYEHYRSVKSIHLRMRPTVVLTCR
jgi:hypothetical protein